MLVILCGPSGCGKSTLAKRIVEDFNITPFEHAEEVVMTTTRAPRAGEREGVDYYFKSVDEFRKIMDHQGFVYSEEYSGERFYGVTKETVREYLGNPDKIGILVTTPQGLRSVKNMLHSDEEKMSVFSCFLECSLGERVKRYIDRIGTDKFSFDDMSEISARVNRDFGMFLGIESDVNKTFVNETKENLLGNSKRICMAMKESRECLQNFLENKERDSQDLSY